MNAMLAVKQNLEIVQVWKIKGLTESRNTLMFENFDECIKQPFRCQLTWDREGHHSLHIALPYL